MLEILSEIYCKNKYIALYTDTENTSSFIYGRVLAFNEDYVAVYAISPDGEFDGILVKQIASIIRIELEGRYADKMSKLCSCNQLQPFDYTISSEDIMRSLLLLARENSCIVSLELQNSGLNDIVGFVDEFIGTKCRINQVDDYGEKDGVSYVAIKDITQLSYASKDEVRLMKLVDIKNNTPENTGAGSL